MPKTNQTTYIQFGWNNTIIGTQINEIHKSLIVVPIIGLCVQNAFLEWRQYRILLPGKRRDASSMALTSYGDKIILPCEIVTTDGVLDCGHM
jgi:hypothetical protein